MSKVCEVCGKHPVAGRSISHSHRVTKMNVCSTCLKSGKVARS